VYKHLDMGDLAEKLQASQTARTRLVVTDGAFSMDGDVAPLKEIVVRVGCLRRPLPLSRDASRLFGLEVRQRLRHRSASLPPSFPRSLLIGSQALAKKYNAHVFIDECHATGFFGPTGELPRGGGRV
jgi:glycine C-acetyltransferase